MVTLIIEIKELVLSKSYVRSELFKVEVDHFP